MTTQPEGLAAQEKMELGVLFAASGVSDYFEAARDEVAANYRGVIQAAAEPLAEYRFAIARALVARSIQLDRDTNDTPEGWLAATGLDCDRMVELLMAALGGEERGIADRVKERAGRLVTGIATRRFRRRRGRYSDQFAPFGADVIVYQTRPRPIRDYIRGIVYKASATAKARGESGAVTVVAHSLGGVATFDALLEKPDPAVRRLITVGSQVPLLYELDALSSMPLRRDRSGAVMATPHQLPDNFPKWLNVYDPRDFLSYRAEPVFGGASVQDIEVDNSLPFPEAHSGYWRNHNVWSTIFERLKGDGDG